MVACSQPLAAEAGLEILRLGGNAAEAGAPRSLLSPACCSAWKHAAMDKVSLAS